MRETELWERLTQVLGPVLVRAWAESVVIAELGQRTVVEAISAGLPFKQIWRSAARVLEVPPGKI